MSSERSAGELRPRNGVPSRTLTGNLTFRTRPLCVLSYGDQKTARTQNPLISGKAGWFWTRFAAFGRTHLAAACKATGGIFETVDRLATRDHVVLSPRHLAFTGRNGNRNCEMLSAPTCCHSCEDF